MELPGRRGVGEHPDQAALRHGTEQVPNQAVRRRVGGQTIDKLGIAIQGDIEEASDIRRILIAVFIERHDPFRTRGGRTGQGGGMLTEIAGQPNEFHGRPARRQRLHHHGRVVDGAIMDQNHLGDAKEATPRGALNLHQGRNLADERFQGPFSVVNGYDNRQGVKGFSRSRGFVLVRQPRSGFGLHGRLRTTEGGTSRQRSTWRAWLSYLRRRRQQLPWFFPLLCRPAGPRRRGNRRGRGPVRGVSVSSRK
jgi:hypothetical protein